MSHSAMNRRLMLDWVRHCSETGEPMPDDAAIVERFGFTSPLQARTLLAELADAGEITISWAAGGVREGITLGRPRKRAVAATPAINRGPRIDSASAAPLDLERLRSDGVAKERRERAVPPPAEPSPALTAIAAELRPAAAAPPASEEAIVAKPAPKPSTPSGSTAHRTFAFSAGGELRARIERHHRAQGGSVSAALTGLIERGLLAGADVSCAAGSGKPRMSVAALRAFQASGEELGPWLSRMIEAGVRAEQVSIGA